MDRHADDLSEEAERERGSKFRNFPAAAGFSLLDPPRRLGCHRTSKSLFNILLLVTFTICIILFTVTLIKYSELSEELKRGRTSALNHSELLEELKRWQPPALNFSQDLVAAMVKSSEDLRKLTGVMCKQCPAGWLNFKDTCYLFSGYPLSHHSSKQACLGRVSQLAIINNREEQNFLTQNTNSKGYWIDLSDSDSEGKWHWGDGSPLTFTNWNRGEPNNDKNREDCAEMRLDGFWNDIPCTDTYNFICEKIGSC